VAETVSTYLNDEIIHQLDATGLLCPEPIMLLHQKVKAIGANQLVRVSATDPSTTRDIPKFCTFLGHELVMQTEEEVEFHYLIRTKSRVS